MQKLIVFALPAAACSLSPAQEALVSGSVERISLLPLGTAECPNPPQTFAPQPDGSTRVSVSNYSGCQVTDIKVDKVLLGAGHPGAILQVKSRLGEWGKPTFPVSSALLLVQVKDGAARWSPIETRDGAETFEAKPFDVIGTVPAASLKGDHGKVTLDELRKALAERR